MYRPLHALAPAATDYRQPIMDRSEALDLEVEHELTRRAHDAAGFLALTDHMTFAEQERLDACLAHLMSGGDQRETIGRLQALFETAIRHLLVREAEEAGY